MPLQVRGGRTHRDRAKSTPFPLHMGSYPMRVHLVRVPREETATGTQGGKESTGAVELRWAHGPDPGRS